MGKDSVITCVCCSVVIDTEAGDLANYTPDGDVCETCFMDEYTVCEYDNETVVANDDVVEVNYMRGWQARSMFVAPDNADEYFVETVHGELWHRNDVVITGDGDYISQRDYDNDYFTCDECGDVYHYDDERSNDDDERVCRHCYSSPRYKVINKYNFRPEPYFHGDDVFNTIGTETEIDFKEYMSDSNLQSAAQYVLNQFGTLMYNKEDGSLTRGFEFVSHPATYEYLYSQKQVFADTFKHLSELGFKSHDTETCGLHIHVSRQGFKNQQAIDNFVYLFEKFYDQVLKFSRRTPYTMQRWADRYGVYNTNDTNKTFSEKLARAYHEKYRIVNLLHSKTLEVRAFKGTLNVDTWFASVQFMLVMKHLANTVDNVVNGVTWQSVVKLAKVKGYTELSEYLVKRGLHNINTKRPDEYEVKQVSVAPGEHFVIIGNTAQRIHHYLPLFTAVRVVNTLDVTSSRGNRVVVEPLDSDVRNNLYNETSQRTQMVWLYDLATVGDDGVYLPLSHHSVTLNIFGQEDSVF